MNELGDTVQRLVVPRCRRSKMLGLAHGGLVSGGEKTRARLARYFTWPGIHKDILEHGKTCPSCQKAGTHPTTKAPLQPLPCVLCWDPFPEVGL